MIASESEVFGFALALPAQRREALVRILLDSLPPADAASIEASWMAELERRLDAHDADPSSAIPAEEVYAKYRR